MSDQNLFFPICTHRIFWLLDSHAGSQRPQRSALPVVFLIKAKTLEYLLNSLSVSV